MNKKGSMIGHEEVVKILLVILILVILIFMIKAIRGQSLDFFKFFWRLGR